MLRSKIATSSTVFAFMMLMDERLFPQTGCATRNLLMLLAFTHTNGSCQKKICSQAAKLTQIRESFLPSHARCSGLERSTGSITISGQPAHTNENTVRESVHAVLIDCIAFTFLVFQLLEPVLVLGEQSFLTSLPTSTNQA